MENKALKQRDINKHFPGPHFDPPPKDKVREMMKIENEYGPERRAMGAAGHAYINWAANMAVELGTGVPWVETDAPDPMYHGGTNFGRSAGGPFITTSYDYDAPIDEFVAI
ncbi:hypothetical protein Ahy_B07g086266 [Arachis hypogaea]|uniref:beta-galactosidase n=1 Tax=Arachis hypogaea TaxID=3818 RepID=A0A444Y9C5_ARAHY|nr:hypothetical protein Ahy_B07g086266 [Arachis hypogaea]